MHFIGAKPDIHLRPSLQGLNQEIRAVAGTSPEMHQAGLSHPAATILSFSSCDIRP